MKTAVEWLEDKLNGVDTGVSNHYFKEIIEQANEMFEQQIVSSYRDGRSDQQSNNSIWFNRKAEQYYNETFNQNKMDERDYKAMNEEIKNEQMTLEKQLEYLGFEVYDYPTFRYELDNCYLVVDCNNGYTLIEDRGDEIVRGCKTIESITNLLRALQC